MNVSPEGAGFVEIDGDAEAEYPAEFEIESLSARPKTVKIEAFAKEGYHFVKWSGEPTVQDNPDYEILYRNLSFTAEFAPDDNREFTSDDETLTISIPKETTALDGEGNPLTEIEFIPVEEELDASGETSIIGLPYQLLPEGATFDQPVTLTWNYDQGDVPEGTDEEDLIVARCDTCADGETKWEELEIDIDPEDDIITAYIDHFSTFAVISYETAEPSPSLTSNLPASFTLSSLNISPSEVNAGEPVSISILLTNAGKDGGTYAVTLMVKGEIEEVKEINLAGGDYETVKFTTSQSEAGNYSIDVNGLPGSFTVKEADIITLAPAATNPEESNPWFTRIVIIAISAAVAVPLIVRWRRRRMDYGTLDYISPRFR